MRVSGTGNPSARILFVSDACTEFECRVGRPLLGTAGDKFDFWLSRTCRLTRDDVWVTTLQREFSKQDREATAEEIEEFWIEVNSISPRVIVAFGSESLRLLLGAWATMDLCYALPHYSPVNSVGVVGIPHPGGVQYNRMVEGFEQLAKFLRGDIGIHTVDARSVDYQECPEVSDAESWNIVGIDTEGSVEHPWCLTYSTASQRAGLIRATQRFELDRFQDALAQNNPIVVMHYVPHDLRVLEAMGVTIPPHITIYDTMQLAYISGQLPQGLKTLAYRLCGMRMRDYEDLIAVHDERIALHYLHNLEDIFAPASPKAKKHPVYKAVKRCLRAKRGPRALWADQKPEIHAAALEVHGRPMPEATLSHVPFEEVLQYACADADATRRVFLKMRELFT